MTNMIADDLLIQIYTEGDKVTLYINLPRDQFPDRDFIALYLSHNQALDLAELIIEETKKKNLKQKPSLR